MFDIKQFICLATFATVIKHGQSQGILDGLNPFGGGGSSLSGIDRLPGVGACDRIASRGVGDCMKNFLPTRLLNGFNGGSGANSNGICCNYSKYRACINGLHAGLRIAMERERCPKSYSTRIIKSLGDSTPGLPLKTFCGSNSNGRSKCPPSRTTKPKKNTNNKPSRRTQPEEDQAGVFQPVQNIFNGGRGRGESNNPSFLNPVRDVFQRGAETFQQGASAVLGGAQSLVGGLGGLGGGLGGLRGAGKNFGGLGDGLDGLGGGLGGLSGRRNFN